MSPYLLHQGRRNFSSVGLGTTQTLPPPPPPPPTPGTGSGHLIDVLTQPGDQIVVLEDGDGYDIGAALDSSNWEAIIHAPTGGIYNGWLIIMAQTQGGVTVDGSQYQFNLENLPADGHHKDPRIMWVGVNFTNWMQNFSNVQWMRYWYCNFDFSVWAWLVQYAAHNAGGYPTDFTELSSAVIARMPHLTASACRLNLVTHFDFLGCDFRHIGDDGIFQNGSGSDVNMFGCKQWDMLHHNKQYFSPFFSDPTTYMHSDGFQTRADSGMHLRDSWFGGDLELSTEGGDLYIVDMQRLWVAGGPTVAGVISDAKANPDEPQKAIGTLSWTMDDVTVFANAQFLDADYESGQSHPATPFVTNPFTPTDYGWQEFFVDIPHSPNCHPNWTFLHQDYTSPGANGIDGPLPSGITVNGAGILTDIANAADPTIEFDLPQISNHPLNPANLWRAAHPYESWPTYYGTNWPGGD